jgi:hypothetical protein
MMPTSKKSLVTEARFLLVQWIHKASSAVFEQFSQAACTQLNGFPKAAVIKLFAYFFLMSPAAFLNRYYRY